MRLEVSRFPSSEIQTLSIFHVIGNDGCSILNGVMLELSDKNNQRRVSRINEGEYTCIKRYSEKYGNHFHVLDVEGRDYILIHHGNFYTNTAGCLIVGMQFKDINGDGYDDVTKSKYTMRRLNEILPSEFQLIIKRD